MGLGRPLIFVKFPTEAAGDLLLLKMCTLHMSSAITSVTELFPTGSTLKLFLRWEHRGVKDLFHQTSKYIYKHRRLQNENGEFIVLTGALLWSYGVNNCASKEVCLDRWLLT